jgi:hypothetical protein
MLLFFLREHDAQFGLMSQLPFDGIYPVTIATGVASTA